ncbi:unnamed protein product [Orchesella dallaii]|uniref:Peptidase S1 domain-containing protein n=1 Tax=Orchesella dallaii TaxID=48710 RepID=A0ABP1Q7H4_9HEXA
MNLQFNLLVFIIISIFKCDSSQNRPRSPSKFEPQYNPRYRLNPTQLMLSNELPPGDQTGQALEDFDARLTGRIVGGKTAQEGDIQYQLRIEARTAPKRLRRCGASLVLAFGVQFGVTAAHCLTSRNDTKVTLSPKVVNIIAGAYNVKNFTGREQRRNVTRLVIHHLYDSSDEHKRPFEDIGLVFFSSPFKVTKLISPILLPDQNWDQPDEVLLSGWGFTSSRGPKMRPDILQTLWTPTIPIQFCKMNFEYDGIKLSERQICNLKDKAGACGGDSGGPAAARNVTNRRWYLAGIASYNLGLCGSGMYPSVYVRVSSYINWIKRHVSDYKKANK